MTHRLLSTSLALLFLVAGMALAAGLPPDRPYVTFDEAKQDAMTPDMAIEKLKAGNRRFVEGNMHNRDLSAQAQRTASGQYPFAVVLSCLDSRSAPEIVFDQGVGDLFVARVAGNVISDDMLGSFEFATQVSGSKLIVVMGHSACGAVMGACDGVELGHLTGLLAKITPAVDATPVAADAQRNAGNAEFVEAVTEANAKLQVAEILRQSPIIKALVDEGHIKVVPAIHNLRTGEVQFL
ncbi:carbonic anhydrase [Thiocapsa marina 5811]|uniref:Carbonic anhydrase n=2 Tax=Thiocapsa marina TaxID=244573 RepID=F9UGH5_9GAMM|nr:carbonic anhydrase [Thiocapsa marina 5811]